MPDDPLLSNPNVGSRLSVQTAEAPDRIAIATPLGSHRQGTNRPYQTITMRELDVRSSAIAAGLQEMGVGPGKRIGLLVRFGEDFITLVFAVLKSGATLVLIDPGMGRRNLIQCLAESQPDGFIAIPVAHAILKCFGSKFPNAKLNVTVGKKWIGMPSPTLSQLENCSPSSLRLNLATPSDPAAIIFTTGSTGPPKGVLYTHRTFNSQIDQIADQYRIAPGGKDLSCFPLFGLFNAVMGTTTILPDMNPIRPADVEPGRLLDAVDQWQINQSFGSPALWTRVGGYCQENGRRVPSLRLVLSAGAPVPSRVLEQMRSAMHPEGCMYTPYGATEALPIASIESRTVLGETSLRTRQGYGTCVGNRFSGIQWCVIGISDTPIQNICDTKPLAHGMIGELMVSGKVVTREYVTRLDQNALHKVFDGERVWHRMGDVGYLDEQDRFWFCGRKSHRVITPDEVLHTETVEAIANTHPSVYRSALIGLGKRRSQTAMLIVEPWPVDVNHPKVTNQHIIDGVSKLLRENPRSKSVERIAVYPKKLPTDIRHNSKIFREQLTVWANDRYDAFDANKD
ncbi:MAG: fatty acid CoA ligase family protein [Pirellula sp.]